MFRFDPTLLQIALALGATLAAGFFAAWAVVGGGERETREGAGERSGEGPESSAGDRPLEPLQKAILWTLAVGAGLFLLWWATLSTSTGGRSPL